MSSTTWEDVWTWLIGIPLRILVIVALAVLLRWLVHRAIRRVEESALARADEHQRSRVNRVLADVTGADRERRRQRAQTMSSVLRSVSTISIYAVAGLTIMAYLGIPLGPLLASAGVGGVALGFGAQSLVKDFLSGIFMIVEDQYGVGDVIDTGQATGTVEEITLRVTRIRDGNGVVWFIRNGEILRIGNQSQGWALAQVDVPVAYEEDPERIIEILQPVVADLGADPEWSGRFLEAPSITGVEGVSGGTLTLRVVAKTPPGGQWAVQRELRRRVKSALDAAGVRGAPPPAGG